MAPSSRCATVSIDTLSDTLLGGRMRETTQIDTAITGARHQAALNGLAPDFFGKGPNLLGRWQRYADWLQDRLETGVEPYSKTVLGRVGPETLARLRDGSICGGLNFASQDYLNLSTHPEIEAAAKTAVDLYGLHSAGSAALMGNSEPSEALERTLARFLTCDDCTVFPTGWGAGYGVIKTLVSRDDHIVIDVLAHASLQEGARAATHNVHHFPHLSNVAVQRRLERLRRESRDAGILVVSEGLFSMDSDVPDIAELQDICHRYDATLLLDVAHDLGALGPTGRGSLELQSMLGKVDIVMGSFSKTFASNGGFVACNNYSLKLALRYNSGPLLFTNAISPVQASVVLAAIAIIDSSDGAKRRERLRNNCQIMRGNLESIGLDVRGQMSAIVPVILGGNARSRLLTRAVLDSGAAVNLVEYPAVSRNACRWRLQLMSAHTAGQIDEFSSLVARALQGVTPKIELDGIEAGRRSIP